MPKQKVRDLVAKVVENVKNDNFVEAGKIMETVVKGKTRNRIDSAKARLFPTEKPVSK